MGDQFNPAEAIKEVLNKLNNAKEAYEWLRSHGENADEKDKTAKYTLFYEANNVVEVVLRCFMVEKGITFYHGEGRMGNRTYEVQDLSLARTQAILKEYVGSILYHNSLHPDCTYLEDVDFAAFDNDLKEDRNHNVHLGVPGHMRELYRVFKNLNRILLELECNTNKCVVELMDYSDSFDFTKFFACMDDINTDERKFVLIADSVHDVDRDKIGALLRIPWSLVLDFDGSSALGGLQTAMDSYGIQYNRHLLEEFNENNTISYYPGRIMYVALCKDTDFRDFYHASKKEITRDDDYVPRVAEKIKNTRTKATIVVMASHSDRVRDLIKNIKKKYHEIDVIYLQHQDNPVVEVTEDEEWAENGENIAAVNVFDNSIFEALERIKANEGMLPSLESKASMSDEAIYTVKISGDKKWGINDEGMIRKIEECFEFVHLNVGKDQTEINEWQFFHGDTASWATIHYGQLPILSRNAERFMKIIRDHHYHGGAKNTCYYLLHAPGIGGSTLGRQISFELKNEMPVLLVKKYISGQIFATMLSDIYIHMMGKNSFLIVIDENLFSEKEMQDMEKLVQNSDYRMKALFVKRISEDAARERYKNQKETELLFTRLESEEKEKLKSRCYQLLQSRDEAYKYESRVKALEETINEKERFALLINLYLLEENFKLETYVKRFLDLIPDDSDGEKMKRLLIFTAICAYFSNKVMIPVSYYSSYLSFTPQVGNRDHLSVDRMFSNFHEGLLLKADEGGIKWYGVKHYLIAEEMLRQLIGDDRWDAFLPDYARALIDMLYNLSVGFSEMDEVVRDIVTALFTDKTRDREQRANGDATALLDRMDEPARLDVICYLAEQLEKIILPNIPEGQKRMEYRLLAHVYAQCARIRSKCMRVNEETIDESEVDYWVEKTSELIYREGIFEYDLEDMLGRCYLDRLKRTDDILDWDEEKVEQVLRNVDRAIEHFNGTVWYGSASYGIPGKLESLRRGISTIKTWKGWGDDRLMEHIYGYPKARDYFLMGQDLIQSVDDNEYEISSVGYSRYYEELDQFEKIYAPDEPSKLIQNYENLRDKVDAQDYNGQHFVSSGIINAYERKYFDKGSVYRRSQLIFNALHGDKKAREDAEKIFEHLDSLVKLSSTHDVSYTTFKRWFEYAKFLEKPLSRALDVARIWKDQEQKNYNSMEEHKLLKPYYYLFVITLLLYLNEQGMTAKDVEKRMEDLKLHMKNTSRYTSNVQDWFANGKGMGQLFDSSWINLGDVDSEEKIRVVSGKVVHFEKNSGYFRVTNPPAMSRWADLPVGQSYSKKSDVYFYMVQSGIISEYDVGSGQVKEFKMGFSFERMVASTKSFERNIKKSGIVEERKVAPTVETPQFVIPQAEFAGQDEIETLAPETETAVGEALYGVSELVNFHPKYFLESKGMPGQGFLNGELDSGQKAGVGTSDLARFGEMASRYGQPSRILKLLGNADTIKARIVDDGRESAGAKLSIFDAGIGLELLLEQARETGCVDFRPDYDGLVESYNGIYLNGALSNGDRGGFSLQDIELFEEECNEYGGAEAVMEKLSNLSSFKVVVENDTNPDRCKVSVYNACMTLEDIFAMPEEAAKTEEVAVTDVEEIQETELPIADEPKLELPDLAGKTVMLEHLDFSKTKTIVGDFEWEGERYTGMVTNVTLKVMKANQSKAKIPVKVQSKSDKHYILRL